MPFDRRTCLSCLCIILSVLSGGALFTFPLFGPSLTSALGLTMTQTNAIAVGAIVGQYSTGWLFGALFDSRGPGFVSLCAAVLLTSGYGLMAFSLDHLVGNWLFLAAYYLLAGAGTSASYFAAVSTSVKTFPLHSGLAIGVPCAVFGLSPLIMSWIGSHLFNNDKGELNAVGFLNFLAFICLLVNLFGAAILREPEVSPFSEEDQHKDSLEDSTDEQQPLLPHSTAEEDQNPLKAFLWNKEVWLFSLAFLLAAGPSEGIQASLGSIVEALSYVKTQQDPMERPWPSDHALQARSRQVQTFALCNTLARLGAGALSDAICPVMGAQNSRRISRLWIYAFSTFQLALALIWAVFKLDSVDQLYALSIPSGLNYGIAFSITPSIIANRWGLKHFGLHWGLIVLACGIGGCFFTELTGWILDLNTAPSQTLCHGTSCFKASFGIMAVSLAFVTVTCLLLSFKRGWRGAI